MPHIREAWTRVLVQVCPLPTSATAPSPRPLPALRAWCPEILAGVAYHLLVSPRAGHSLGRRWHTGPRGHWGSKDPGVARPSSLTGKPCWSVSAHSPSVPHTMAGGTQGTPALGAGSKSRLATPGTPATGRGLTWSPQPGSGTWPSAWGACGHRVRGPGRGSSAQAAPAPTSPPSLS